MTSLSFGSSPIRDGIRCIGMNAASRTTPPATSPRGPNIDQVDSVSRGHSQL